MTTQHDLDQQLNAFLREGPEELPNESFDAVRDRTEQTRQRVILGPWRLPEMNKFLAAGLGAAAVVVVLIVGARLFGPFTGSVGTSDPTATPEASSTAPSRGSDPGCGAGQPCLSEGGFIWFEPEDPPVPPDDGPPITVTIPAAGWSHLPEFGALAKGDDGDPPEATMLQWSTTGGFYVYGDPCHWASSRPDTPATTVDELVAALAAQPSRDASDPVDITIGGYPGKSVTLHVPDNIDFADCDEGNFASFAVEGMGSGPARFHQGPGQIDDLWIVDVGDAIVIIDAASRRDSSITLIDEMRAIAESAVFEAR